ncbi:MAG: PAS domain-containing protein [Armatimonadetes bacterium]|nr:PAS domain-containing protein [Armatimonadota bacterium]
MRRPSLRSQLLVIYLMAVVLPLAGLAYWLPERMRRETLREMKEQVAIHAALVGALLEDAWAEGPAIIAGRCREIGQPLGLRVTVIDKEGRVLGDSEADPSRMDNHSDRIEVREALRNGTGSSQRYSHTAGHDFLYVARRMNTRGRMLGVVRMAESLDYINAVDRDIRYAFWGAFGVAFLFTLIMALALSTRLSAPIYAISEMAARVADGEVGQKVRVSGTREMTDMAGNFNRMSQQLAATIRQIAEGKQRLETILERMADGIIIVDSAGCVELFNRAAEKMLGVSGEKALGNPFINLTLNYRMTQTVEDTLRARAPQMAEIEIHAPVKRLLKVYTVPVQTGGGQLQGAVVVMQDQTEIRRLESIRRDFVTNVSHELRTPIASIKATAEALASGAKDDPELSGRFLETIIGESDRLASLVDDLLELARTETRQVRLEQTDVPLRPLVSDILDRFDALAGEKQIALDNEVPEKLVAWADRDALSQILGNLIDNAVKYTQPKGFVHISAAAEEDFIGIQVADTGIGILQEHQSRIFERFYRVDRSRSRSLGGTGLGLAIVKHLVEAHGGSVQVQSTLGQGSAFILRLPRAYHLI